jgi:hypothetical protein
MMENCRKTTIDDIINLYPILGVININIVQTEMKEEKNIVRQEEYIQEEEQLMRKNEMKKLLIASILMIKCQTGYFPRITSTAEKRKLRTNNEREINNGC